jgi:hypothetical protein
MFKNNNYLYDRVVECKQTISGNAIYNWVCQNHTDKKYDASNVLSDDDRNYVPQNSHAMISHIQLSSLHPNTRQIGCSINQLELPNKMPRNYDMIALCTIDSNEKIIPVIPQSHNLLDKYLKNIFCKDILSIVKSYIKEPLCTINMSVTSGSYDSKYDVYQIPCSPFLEDPFTMCNIPYSEIMITVKHNTIQEHKYTLKYRGIILNNDDVNNIISVPKFGIPSYNMYIENGQCYYNNWSLTQDVFGKWV